MSTVRAAAKLAGNESLMERVAAVTMVVDAMRPVLELTGFHQFVTRFLTWTGLRSDTQAVTLVGTVGILITVLIFGVAFLRLVRRFRNSNDDETPERLKVFAKWALQQIEESTAGAHMEILDDVIQTFATYAQRLEEDPSPTLRRAAVLRLLVLADVLEEPAMNVAFRSSNWSWVSQWERGLLDAREARVRCTTIFPTICAAAKAQLEHGGSKRLGQGITPLSLQYLASWCMDFVERADVRQATGLPGYGVSFLSAGVLYSDSDEESDDDTMVVGSNMREKRLVSDPSSIVQDFSCRTAEGQDHCWDFPDCTQAVVRGSTYLLDRVKVPSAPAMLELVEVDLVRTNDEIVHYATCERGKIPGFRASGDRRFYFVINFRLPPIQLCITWAENPHADWAKKPEGNLFHKFCQMSVKERNTRIKVLPKVLEGPWLVKKGVPDRPGVIGKKLALDYFQADDHLEISINCISSATGRRLVQLLTGAARHFSMALYIILEGQSEDELPERVLGGISVFHGDLSRLPVR